MALDVNTLFIVTIYVEAMLGLLLLFAWIQNSGIHAVAWWGCAHLLRAMSVVLFGLYGTVSDGIVAMAKGNTPLIAAPRANSTNSSHTGWCTNIAPNGIRSAINDIEKSETTPSPDELSISGGEELLSQFVSAAKENGVKALISIGGVSG